MNSNSSNQSRINKNTKPDKKKPAAARITTPSSSGSSVGTLTTGKLKELPKKPKDSLQQHPSVKAPVAGPSSKNVKAKKVAPLPLFLPSLAENLKRKLLEVPTTYNSYRADSILDGSSRRFNTGLGVKKTNYSRSALISEKFVKPPSPYLNNTVESRMFVKYIKSDVQNGQEKMDLAAFQGYSRDFFLQLSNSRNSAVSNATLALIRHWGESEYAALDRKVSVHRFSPRSISPSSHFNQSLYAYANHFDMKNPGKSPKKKDVKKQKVSMSTTPKSSVSSASKKKTIVQTRPFTADPKITKKGATKKAGSVPNITKMESTASASTLKMSEFTVEKSESSYKLPRSD